MHAASVSKLSIVAADLDALLARMRDRLYPETIPVLASYWLKTVCNAGHNAVWWREMRHLLARTLREEQLDAISRQALVEIQDWIASNEPGSGKTAPAASRPPGPFRDTLRKEWLMPYVSRLLNEWLPAEAARLLVGEWESLGTEEDGVPPLATGLALERLLVRERLSRETLEMLLWPENISPQFVYPADAEMLTDVVLALLGRTQAPPPPALPAVLIALAARSALPPDYAECVRRASIVSGRDGDELHVPIAAEHALQILKGDPVHIGSVIVTMDGRWWQSESLESGEQHTVVYKPGGRLRIDTSMDHGRLDLPWPDVRLKWRGGVHLQGPFQIFGREWHAANWQTDGEHSILRLEFSRPLPAGSMESQADALPPRSHPASVDMAWASMEAALATALASGSRDAIEQLHQSDLIPVGRALFRLSELLAAGRQPTGEGLEMQLKALRYLESATAPVFGRVPWRTLPSTVQAPLLKKRVDPALAALVNEVFEGAPLSGQPWTPSSRAVSNVPPQAA